MIIKIQTVEGKPNHRVLTDGLPVRRVSGDWTCIPPGFEWDGSSVPVFFQGIFPRHRHPIASCRHDWRCRNARNKAERKWADREFEKDVGKTSWWVTKKIGYIGVRVGAFFGVGVNY